MVSASYKWIWNLYFLNFLIYWAIPFNIGTPLLRGLEILWGGGGGGGGGFILKFPRG